VREIEKKEITRSNSSKVGKILIAEAAESPSGPVAKIELRLDLEL